MVDGIYDIEVVAMGQERTGTITLKTDEGRLEGVLDALGHTFEFSDGKATENTFDFAIKANGQKLSLLGTVEEDGSINGDGKFGFVPLVLIGTRKAEA